MKTVELYARVRRAVLVEEMSRRAEAREFGLARKTVGKMLEYSAPPGYQRQKPVKRPKLSSTDHTAKESSAGYQLADRLVQAELGWIELLGKHLLRVRKMAEPAIRDWFEHDRLISGPGNSSKPITSGGLLDALVFVDPVDFRECGPHVGTPGGVPRAQLTTALKMLSSGPFCVRCLGAC
jgi:hypothetical protein